MVLHQIVSGPFGRKHKNSLNQTQRVERTNHHKLNHKTPCINYNFTVSLKFTIKYFSGATLTTKKMKSIETQTQHLIATPNPSDYLFQLPLFAFLRGAFTALASRSHHLGCGHESWAWHNDCGRSGS